MENWSLITYYCAVTMLIIAYLLGSIPSAVWIGKKYYGIDIREYGSKNAGTTNMLRVLGRRAALPVFVLDFFKGFVAVSLIGIMRYDIDITSAWLINLKIMGVFAAVLGHIFPIFAGFKGGKGVATLVGAITGIYPIVVLLCFAVWVLVFLITHYVSLASMTAGCSFPDLRHNLLVDGVVARQGCVDVVHRLFIRRSRIIAEVSPQEHRTPEGRHRIEDICLATPRLHRRQRPCGGRRWQCRRT